jgi:hypothetical protein
MKEKELLKLNFELKLVEKNAERPKNAWVVSDRVFCYKENFEEFKDLSTNCLGVGDLVLCEVEK